MVLLQYPHEEIDLRLQNIVRTDIVRVAKGGDGDTDSIQTAIDQATAGELIRIYPGTYQENVVVDGNRTIECLGALGNNVFISPSSGDALTIDSGNVFITNLGVICATNANTDIGIKIDGGILIFDNSFCNITTTTTVHNLCQINSGGQFYPSKSRFLYNQGGLTTGDNKHIIYDINGSGICQPAISNSSFICTDASDIFCVGDVESGSTGTFDLVSGAVGFALTNASWNGSAYVMCAENSGNKKKINSTLIQTTGVATVGELAIFASTGANGTEFISTNVDFGNIDKDLFDEAYLADVDGSGVVRDENSNITGVFSNIQKLETTGEVKLSNSEYDSFDFNLTGSVVAPQIVNGANTLVSSGNTGNVSTLLVNGHHIMLTVNSVTPNATLTLTGTSMSESSGVPTTGDTEVITVDATGVYQSSKKWAYASITVSGTINYDVSRLGYEDYSNTDFRLSSWRLEAVSEGPATSLRFRIVGVEDLGDKKMQLNIIEDMTIDNTGITDNLRTGADDRSDTSPVTYWVNTTTTGKKQIDFNVYFTSGENIFKGSSLDEGYYLEIVSFNKVGILRFGINRDKV